MALIILLCFFVLKYRSSVCSLVWSGRSRSSFCGTEHERTRTRAEPTCSCRGRRGPRWDQNQSSVHQTALSLSFSLMHCECLSPSCSSTRPQSPPWFGSPEVRSSLTSLPVSDTLHTESVCTTWTVTRDTCHDVVLMDVFEEPELSQLSPWVQTVRSTPTFKPVMEPNDLPIKVSSPSPPQGMLGDPWRFPTRWTSGQRSIVSLSCVSSVTLPMTTVSTLTSTVFRCIHFHFDTVSC